MQVLDHQNIIKFFIELLCDEKGGMIFALFENKYD